MSSETAVSSIGLVLCMAPGLLHSVEVMFPMLSRWIVNYVLPLFGPALPRKAESLTYGEQITMLEAALEASPEEKRRAATDYVFLMLFEQRQGSLAFVSVVVGALYGLTLSVAERRPLHLVFVVMAVLFALVNTNHAGVRFLGHHPKVSRNGRNVGIVFAPFWAAAAVLNWLVFASWL